MPQKKSPASPAKAKKRSPQKRKKSPAKARKKTASTAAQVSTRRRWWWMLALFLGLMQLLYLGWLQYRIHHHFDGGQWDLPSRVYARPLELFNGLKLSPEQLQYELKLVGYQAVKTPRNPGEYARDGEHWQVFRRAFAFAEKPESAQQIRFRLRQNTVSKLQDGAGQALLLQRLEPWLMGEFQTAAGEDRIVLKAEQIPQRLVDILIAVEDRGFASHWGLSPSAIARALWANIRAGRTVQGGSTLTQQLAKNFFLDSRRKLLRKYHEAWLALLLEAQYSKQEILTAYINEVFLLQLPGRAVHGFGLSSQLLFNRPITELNDAQMALMVGMIKGPSYYQPMRHRKRATERRNVVLNIMQQQGLLDQATGQKLKQQPLGVVKQLPGKLRHQSYLTLVQRQLRQYFDTDVLRQQGLRILTPFDPWQQQKLDQAVMNSAVLERRESLQAAAVIADYATGEVLALNSDRNPLYAGFNRALDAQRPIGSLFKPVILASLLQNGYHLSDRFFDRPLQLKQSDGKIWAPQNYDRKFRGKVTLLQALSHSYNLPWVHAGLEIGLPKITETLQQLAMPVPETVYPSMLLGTLELSPLQVAQLYQGIANQGFATPLSAIREVYAHQGGLLQRFPFDSQTVLNAEVAAELQRALRSVVAEGTARSLQNLDRGYLAAKTGTSSDKRDSWFVGYDQRTLGVFWLGHDNNQSTGLSGSSGALRVFADWYR